MMLGSSSPTHPDKSEIFEFQKYLKNALLNSQAGPPLPHPHPPGFKNAGIEIGIFFVPPPLTFGNVSQMFSNFYFDASPNVVLWLCSV